LITNALDYSCCLSSANFLLSLFQNIWGKFADGYRARHVVWLKEFKTFKDKSSAIRLDTGVDSKLSKMIMKWRRHGQTLVVGKPEYKTIIEN